MPDGVGSGVEIPDSTGPGTLRQSDSSRLFADATTVLTLWADSTAWIQRRVERVELVDSDWVRRSVTLDLDVPWDRLDDAVGTHVSGALLPITVSARASRLVNVDLTEGSGRRLAIASRRQLMSVIGAAIGLFMSSSKGPVEADRLSAVASSAAHAFVAGAASPDDLSVLETLPEPVSSLVLDVIAQRLVLVSVSRGDPANVIRCVWEEEIVRQAGFLSGLRGALRGVTLMVDVGGAGSYHLEATAPPALVIEDVTFISTAEPASSPLERARDHVEMPVAGRGKVLLRLRPATALLSLQFMFALAALGMALALIAAAPVSVTQSAVAALLLVLPGVLTLYQSRIAGWLSFIEFGGARQLLFVSTFVAAAALSIGGGSGEAVRELLLVSAGGTTVAAGALAALGLSGRRPVRLGTDERFPRYVSYRAESRVAPVYPDDREIEQAIEDLIKWLPSVEQPSPARTPDGEGLKGSAAALAERSSWVVSERPAPPLLSGDLLEDVLALTGMSRLGLAEALGVSVAEFAREGEEYLLPTELRNKLAALRAAGLALYGGLGTVGVRQWLTTGTPSPIGAIASGCVEDVRAKVDRYMSSPAE